MPVLKALVWLTIEEQLRLWDVTMMCKCVNNLLPACIEGGAHSKEQAMIHTGQVHRMPSLSKAMDLSSGKAPSGEELQIC